MESVMPVPRDTTPPPPIDGITDASLARFLQWVADKLIHIDRCMDDVKDSVASLKGEDGDLLKKIEDHQKFHDDMAAISKARRSMFQKWWETVKELGKAGSEVVKFAIAVGALKALGIL